MPNYNDGIFFLFKIYSSSTTFPQECLKQVGNDEDEYYYEELSLTDNLMFENEKRDKKIQLKIRIAQDKNITTRNVLKINDNFYKVFNIFHFKNKDGFLQSDITLEEYLNPKVVE